MGTSGTSASPDRLSCAAPASSGSDGGPRRPQDVARFIDQLCGVLSDRTQDHPSAQCVVRRMRQALDDRAGAAGVCAPRILPACSHLDAALVHLRDSAPGLSALADLLATLSSCLHWQLHSGAASAQFPFRERHANAHIIGPNGIEQRHDLVVGLSLLAPFTTYPNHRYPPREVYLVLSEGEWSCEGTDWHRPGTGGIVYHRPGIVHAMRSGATPLLALWCLWPDQESG